MSAALQTPTRAPLLPPIEETGPGTRARAEADRWRHRGAAADWLAQHQAHSGGQAGARKKERDKEYRAGKSCAARQIGTDRDAGEIDLTAADIRAGAPQAANASEPRREVPDIEGLRHRDSQLWRNILQYLRGCPRARAIIWFLNAGIPRSEMAARMGISERAVNMAHATLRRRMDLMRRGEPVPAGRPEPAGVEFEPVAVSSAVAPAVDLFAAAGLATPEMPAPKKQKARRRKTKKPAPKRDFFESRGCNG